jgi:KUP system potassium uptake protein
MPTSTPAGIRHRALGAVLARARRARTGAAARRTPRGIVRKPGTTVLVCPPGTLGARSFARFLRQARGLPERLLVVQPRVEFVAHVAAADAATLTPLGHGVLIADLRDGFDDAIDVPHALARIRGLALDPATTRYYVIADRVVPEGTPKGWPWWRRRLFAALSAACTPAAEYFRLPADRTTEIRVQAA